MIKRLSAARLAVASLYACAMTCVLSAAAAPLYQATPLFDYPDARFLNNVGQYAGSHGWSSASLYSGGSATDIGNLGRNYVDIRGFNDRGEIVGASDIASGDSHAFLYSGGKMMDLGTLGGRSSEALGINNSGQVVGYAQTATGDYHAFLYSGGAMVDLHQKYSSSFGAFRASSPSSTAVGINNNGDIIGSDGYHSFVVWSSPNRLNYVSGSSLSYGSAWSDAVAVNDNATVLGKAQFFDYNKTVGFLQTKGAPYGPVSIGELPLGDFVKQVVPTGLNNKGQAIGFEVYSGSYTWEDTFFDEMGVPHPFTNVETFTGEAYFFFDGANMYDSDSLLGPESPWIVGSLLDINDSGQILASGYNWHTRVSARLLLSPVPEPETYAMFLAGLGMIGAAVRRRTLNG